MPHDWTKLGEDVPLRLAAEAGAKVGDLVELGADYGTGSTLILARAAQNAGRRLWSIDTFCDFPGFETPEWRNTHTRDNMARYLQNVCEAGLLESVRILKLTTDEAVPLFKPASLGCVLIDAAHCNPWVMRDFQNWPRLVAPGGLLVAHDITTADVAQAIVMMLANKAARWQDVSTVHMTRVWRRV